MDKRIKMSEIRAKFPMYSDLSDDQLLIGLRKSYYADIPMAKFSQMVDYDTDRERLDPTKSMSGVEKFAAGYGGAIPNIARGVGQLLGVVDQADIDEAKRLDAPLMKSGAGMAGNIAGNVAAAIPTAAIPGANTLAGSAIVGGGLGFIQPVASDESRLKNTLIGAAAGPVGVMLGRGTNALYQGGKALIEPFTQRGREQIAGRVINRFAADPTRIGGATSAPTVTGARPTLAEQTGDVGLARLQDSLRAADPQFNNAITQRLADNNAARVNALRGLTGEDGGRAFAAANRSGTSGPIYQEAFNIDAASRLTPELQREMLTLMRSPAIRQAAAAARVNAANAGKNVGPANGSGSIEGLHNIKLALDDAIAAARGGNGSAAQEVKARALTDAQKRLVGFIEQLSPEYATARQVHAQMSKPINVMDVAAEVARKGLSNTADLTGTPIIQRNALLGALRDEPALVQRATGRNLGGLSNVMEPQDLNILRAIASEADRAGAVATAGNGPGSATAQRMASQNVLRQVVGPLGLPESWAENALANTVVGKPLNLVYGGVAEPKIQQALAQAILDPDAARQVLAAAQQQDIKLPPSTMRQLVQQAARATVPMAAIEGSR